MAAATGRWTRLLQRLALAGAVAAASGCAVSGASLESAPEVALWSVGAPLHEPVWSHCDHTRVALTDDHRVAEVTGDVHRADAKTRMSPPLGAGRNLRISQRDDRLVFVPQPQRGRVAAVNLERLAHSVPGLLSLRQ